VENYSFEAKMPNPEQWLDQQRRAEVVRKLIGSLPKAQQRAIELAYFEGMTHSEIAETMNEPLGTVKTWIRSSLLHLRQQLAEAR
jgi:RNA polymerase sigma-70 factor (ECF subfamily)